MTPQRNSNISILHQIAAVHVLMYRYKTLCIYQLLILTYVAVVYVWQLFQLFTP